MGMRHALQAQGISAAFIDACGFLTDLEIEELTEEFLRDTLERTGNRLRVEPRVVIEIAFDSIQPSDRHASGLALRFPRIKQIRKDKGLADIDTLAMARKLAARTLKPTESAT